MGKVSAGSFVFTDFKEYNRSFGNTELKCAYVHFLCNDSSLLFGLLLTFVCIYRSYLATLAMKELNLVFGKAIFTGKVSAIKVGVDLITNDPFKLLDVVLEKIVSLYFGIDTEEESIHALSYNRLRDKGLSYVSLGNNVFGFISISTCHISESPF